VVAVDAQRAWGSGAEHPVEGDFAARESDFERSRFDVASQNCDKTKR